MKVAIRADASIHMGTGHVMRCLTLAESLREKGVEIYFVSRLHTGNLVELVESNGFEVFTLPKGIRQHWDNDSWERDVEQTKKVLAEKELDWLIVDHYALDKSWENELRQYCKNLMVIDDLADRDHDCDLLLDQTLGRRAADYQNRVPSSCTLLLGSQYALLRPEFTKWRELSLSRRRRPELKKILISLGGVDPDNLSGRVLDNLAKENLIQGLETTIVMGKTAQWLDQVRAQAEELAADVKVLSGVDNMAELMADSDLAIGALGTTSWERCCLGLPTLGLILANNQKNVAAELDNRGAIKTCSIENLCKTFKSIDSRELKMMSEASLNVTDGKGRIRVLEEMLNSYDREIFLKSAVKEDCEFFYNLQKEDGARQFSVNPSVPSWTEHSSWYSKALSNDDMHLYKIVLNTLPVGMLRLDNPNGIFPEISIIVSRDHSGLGIATRAIEEAKKKTTRMKALVHIDNLVSKKLFTKTGFKLESSNGNFLSFVYEC